MAHTRKRWLTSIIKAELKWSPAIALFGLRQVGKTTLVKEVTKDLGGTYVTFDDDAQLESSRLSPQEFCDRKGLLCIDEAQKGKWIFSIIKTQVGTKRAPGRFLLTGSVRFTAKKEIHESLAGRVLTHELLPFSLAEGKGLLPSEFLKSCFEAVTESKATNVSKLLERLSSRERSITPADIHRYYAHGGIPVPGFTRDENKRNAWFRSYLEALVARDIPLVEPKLAQVALRQGLGFLRALALDQGQESSAMALADHAGLRPAQATLLLRSLEILCVIDRIPPHVLAKKSVKKLRTEWKDIALRNHALGLPEGAEAGETEMRLLLGQEFRSQLSFLSPSPTWAFYRSREGGQIPWIFRQGRSVIAIHYSGKERPESYDTRTLRAFLDSQPNSIGIFLGSNKATPVVLGKRLIVLPFHVVF